MKKFIIGIFLCMMIVGNVYGADSTRTRTALETLFADQQTGAISAQDLRDFLASVFIQTDDDTLDILGEYLDSTGINYLNSLFDTEVTSTEFDYLDGVTSNIQTQFDAVPDSEYVKVTVDTLELGGENLTVTGAQYLNQLYNTGVTDVEFDCLDGVTSSIQEQIDAEPVSIDTLIVNDAATINCNLDMAHKQIWNCYNLEISPDDNMQTGIFFMDSDNNTKATILYNHLELPADVWEFSSHDNVGISIDSLGVVTLSSLLEIDSAFISKVKTITDFVDSVTTVTDSIFLWKDGKRAILEFTTP